MSVHKKFLIRKNLSIKKAMLKLNKTGMKVLFVVGDGMKLLGSLSDGDIRKAVVSGSKLNSSISKVFNKKPLFYKDDSVSMNNVRKIFKKQLISLIPIVNEKNEITRILSSSSYAKSIYKNNTRKNISNTKVIIMAGGLGLRMKPFTDILPKPLLPLRGKAVIDHILDNFFSSGFKNAYISIRKQSKILEAYFKERKNKIKINFIRENTPLGTAGSIRKVKGNFKNLIVTNCDTILKFNIDSALDFHNKSNFDISIFCLAKDYRLPYGVCILDKEKNFSKIQEKPTFNFFVNTGQYIINKKVLKYIPNRKIDFPELIELSKKNKLKIGIYPVDEKSWFDVGQWNFYKKTLETFN